MLAIIRLSLGHVFVMDSYVTLPA